MLYFSMTEARIADEAAAKPPLTITRALPWGIAIILVTALPYVLGWLTTPDGQVFTGVLLNPDDMGVYVSAMRQGAAGHWLFHFLTSPEPWQPRLMLTPYLVLGKITAVFAEPTVFWLHFWRSILILLSLGGILFWIRTAMPLRNRWGWTAWILILLGGGIGWLAAIMAPSYSSQMPDLGMAEWSPLLALFNTPHFALGLGLEAAVFACLMRVDRAATNREGLFWAIFSALAATAAALVYVYHLAIIGLVVGVNLLIRIARNRQILWRSWLLYGIIVAPLLPLLYYYAFWTNGDPYWEHYTRIDHVVRPPSLWGALIGLGFLGPLAFIGARRWMKEGRSPIPTVWAVVNALALYLPFISFSGRLGLGFLIPVATLAAIGLESSVLPAISRSRFFPLFARLTPPPYASLRRVALILLAPSSLMAILLFAKGPLVVKEFPYYYPGADVEAGRWLGEQTDEGALTFASYPIGNYLPRVYDGKVFMGHLDYTSELDAKVALFERFWNGSMTANEQEAFLREWGITYIFAGTYEALYGTGVEPPGRIIYNKDAVSIYRFE